MRRGKIAAVKRGFILRDLMAESLRRVMTEESAAKLKRMAEALVKLPKGHTIPIQSNQELAQMFEQENIAKIHDVYRGR